MRKTLSIITVCYNSEKQINRSIDSVVPQLNSNVEYVFIDGASNDATRDIIREKCGGIEYKLLSEKDNGIYDAMNKGLDKSSGEYVYFLNTDDCLLPGAVAAITKSIEEYPMADCILGNVKVVDFDSDGTERFIKLWRGDSDLSNLEKGMICSHQGMICKRSTVLEAGGFYTKLKIAADWDLILRLYKKGMQFQYVDMNIARFSRGGVSVRKEHEWERHIVRKRNRCFHCIDHELIIAIKTKIYNLLHNKQKR